MLDRLGFTGRLVAIVLLALLALAATSAMLGFASNWQRGETEGWALLPERAVAVVELLEGSDAHRRALVLKAVNSEGVAVTLTSRRPAQTADPRRVVAVEWILARFLRQLGTREVIAIIEPQPTTSWRDFRVGQLRLFAREPLRIAVGLAGGDWVVFETRVEISPSVLGVPTGFVIGGIGALVGILAILAIAREARPLQQLAASVTRFARDAVPEPVRTGGAPEVQALVGAVNDMQARIAALLKGRTILLGAISHDLKTFITRLRLRIEGIPDGDQQAKAVQDIDDMTALIDDALAIAKGSAVSDRRMRVDLAALLAAEIADRPAGRIQFSPVTSDSTARIEGDPTALRRLIGNLLDNALQHATEISVSVRRHLDCAILHVDDNGPGIPAAERTAVFEPFYRLDRSRSRVTGGSGLGLAIAKQIAEAHRGTITAGISPLGGAQLVVTLPDSVRVH